MGNQRAGLGRALGGSDAAYSNRDLFNDTINPMPNKMMTEWCRVNVEIESKQRDSGDGDESRRDQEGE